MSRGKARYRGKPRPRTATGEYKRCPTWGCRRGQIKIGGGAWGPHQRCGGDGWVKIGDRGRGRRRPKGRGRKPRGALNRVGWYLGGAGAFVGFMGQTFGTIGQVAAVVLVVAFFTLKLVGLVLRGVVAVTGK